MPNPVKVAEYKGFRIFVESDGTFDAVSEETQQSVAKAKTLEAVQKKVDQLVHGKLGQDVWVKGSHYSGTDEAYFLGKVTSLREDKGMERQFRVAYKAKDKDWNNKLVLKDHWNDLRPSVIYKDNQANRDLIEVIHAINKHVREEEGRIDKLEKKLESFTEEELLGGK